MLVSVVEEGLGDDWLEEVRNAEIEVMLPHTEKGLQRLWTVYEGVYNLNYDDEQFK